MKEASGWIKVVFNTTVIFKEFYYSKAHRKRLYREYESFILERKQMMYIYIEPREDRGVERAMPIKKGEVTKIKPAVSTKEQSVIPDKKIEIIRPKATYTNRQFV